MRVIVTGGAGFIGSHLVTAFAKRGDQVTVIDNLSRAGSEARLARMCAGPWAGRIDVRSGDVTDAANISHTIAKVCPHVVLHLAGQVAVTESLQRPAHDFAVNALGTLNVLEAVRVSCPRARVVFASTNKVYGSLADLRTRVNGTRYELPDHRMGISEQHETAARTPYGCSKLVGDLYMREYARSFGVATAVLRLSCIYGPGQSGTEDQGWVSYFVRAAIERRSLTIFGDGLQVRDLLHVSDLAQFVPRLVDTAAWSEPLVFNIGGGPDNSISVWAEFGELLEDQLGYELDVSFAPARLDDQLVYVSDLTRVKERIGWTPTVSVSDGLGDLIDRIGNG